MYPRLRPAPSVCLICAHLSRLRRCRPSGKRTYVAQAALAASPPHPTNVQRELSDTGSSAAPSTKHSQTSSETTPGSPEADPYAKARARTKAGRARREAFKQAEEAEMQRKALAVLGKTSKFATALEKAPPNGPTLVDLEPLRPSKPPLITLEYIYPQSSTSPHHGSPSDVEIESYRAAFQELVDKLTQKFTRKQLFLMCMEWRRKRSDVQPEWPQSKASLKSRRDIAGVIVRWLWEWPHVTEVEQRKAYLTERSDRVFPMSTSEFFLLLGSDGSSLLGLTERFHVRIKQVVRTEDTFSLVIEGPNDALDRLAVVLTERKKGILSELVSVNDPNTCEPTPRTETNSIRPELLQRISKLSEALVEYKGNGTFRISAHHLRNIELATRLTTRASQQAVLPPPRLLAHLPTAGDTIPDMVFPHTYALFPLELPKAASMPWHWISTGTLSPHSESLRPESGDHTESSATTAYSTGIPSLFRARKVSDWFGRDRSSNVSHLRDGVGRLLSTTGQPHTLRGALGLNSLELPDAIPDTGFRKITASTGYIVFSAGAGFRNALLPPLPGTWMFPNLLDWMRADKGRMAFIPNLPKPLVPSSPSDQTVMNQLVYRSLMSDTSTGTSLKVAHSPDSSRTLKIEISINHPTRIQEPLTTGGHGKPNYNTWTDVRFDHMKDASTSASRLQVLRGVESFVNIMLPDRPIDMQISLFDSVPVPPESEPPEIRTYASNLIECLNAPDISDANPRPDPPLHVTYEGIRYVLDSNATIRHSSQRITKADPPTDVLTEHVTDLESDQQTVTYQAICTEPKTPPAWRKFLGDCDRLTWLTEAEESISPMFSESEDNGDDH